MPEQNENQEKNQTQKSGTATPQGNDDSQQKQDPPDPAKRRRTIIIASIVGVFVVAVCIVWWLHSRTYETTDDAQVDGHLNPIAARVAGTITKVYVDDNQHVQAGQPIADLDTRDAEVSLVQAQADYDQAHAQLAAESPNVPIQQVSNRSDVSTSDSEVVNAEAAVQAAQHDYDSDLAKLRQAQATSAKSEADVLRYRQLVEKNELAHSDFDQYVSTAKSNAANVDSAASAAASQKQLIEQRRAQLREQVTKRDETVQNAPREVAIKTANKNMREANLKSYEAKLQQAKLNLAYCHVVAPVNGIVLQRSAEVGGRVSEGQQLLMIAQTDLPWVVANFKETQVRKMHPGQPVDIKVDALSKTFHGTVQDMPAATGDRASVLPAENATGNYVKVIQRLPVRILFKEGQDGMDNLRPGMSVEPKVRLD